MTYLDDIIIFSDMEEEHLAHIKKSSGDWRQQT